MSVYKLHDHGVRILEIESEDDASHGEVEPEISGGYVNMESQEDKSAVTTIEKKIYLRAALKLLDLRDQSIEEKHRWIRGRHEGTTTDLIKYGTLKKSSAAVGRTWKEKYVELRHGVLSYEDLSGWGETSNRKTIKLLFKKVKCYPVKSEHYGDRFVFALAEVDGSKRLWVTDSLAELQSWVDSIKTAMIGSAGDFASQDTSVAEADSDVNSGNMYGPDSSTASTALRHTSQLGEDSCRKHVKNSGIVDSSGYFATDVQRFQSVQLAFTSAPTSAAYRELLHMYASEPCFTVPVSCIKIDSGTTPPRLSLLKGGSNRSLHSLSSQKRVMSTELSQAWKDLHRDVITVNGQVISGAIGGPEEMIGTLVRKILEQVQSMREKYVASIGPPLSATSSTEDIDKVRRRMATYADMDESQALSCARDVLLSCNRTQSGGDTYYTVESLFVNRDFAVLTPFSCEADPLEIVVDIVESEKRRLANVEEPEISESESITAVPNHGDQDTCNIGQRTAKYDDVECDVDVMYGRYDSQGRHSDHSRITDDTTESSGNTHSASEDEESKDHRGRSYRHLTPYSPGAFGIHYDNTELPSDIVGATALPSAVLISRDRRGKGKGTSTSSGGSSIASGSSESTEAEATHSSPDEICSPARPLSMGGVVLPSMLESRETCGPVRHSDDGQQQRGKSAVIGGKHRRHRTDPEPLPVPAAVSAGPGEDETIAMSELTLDSNFQHKKLTKASTFKKAMQFVSPAGKHSSRKTPKLAVEKTRFFNKFGTASPIPSPTPISGVDDSTACKSWPSGESPKVTKKKNLLRRAFGGKSDHDRDKGSATSSPITEKEGLKRGRRHKRNDIHGDSDDEESAAQSMCVRIQVIAKSKYRLCNLDPQNDHDDNWAVITGNFHQVFFLKSNSNGRPSVSDRLITTKIEKV